MGKPRPDKGNLDLPELSRMLYKSFGERVVIHCVEFNEKSRFYIPPHKRLDERNTVRYEGGYLPADIFNELMSTSDIVLFPYDIGTYWLRGSAVLFDAIEKSNALLLARSGLAFADELADHSAIQIFNGFQNLNDIISEILIFDRLELRKKSAVQKQNYIELVSK